MAPRLLAARDPDPPSRLNSARPEPADAGSLPDCTWTGSRRSIAKSAAARILLIEFSRGSRDLQELDDEGYAHACREIHSVARDIA